METRIVLKSGKEQSIRRYHPWIFSGAIKKIRGNPVEGDLVRVYDNNNNFLAIGHYQPGSIAVRILSFENEEGEDLDGVVNEELYCRGECGAAREIEKAIGNVFGEFTQHK